MATGRIVSIHIAERAGGPMRPLTEADLVAGRGIVGDRYHDGTGEFSPALQDPDHEVTLIERENVDRLNAAAGLSLAPEQLRRNIVTEGIALNDLVDRIFHLGEPGDPDDTGGVGSVTLRGIRLCEPCAYLADLTHPDILRPLAHRGGLRAAILKSGRTRIGDRIIGPSP